MNGNQVFVTGAIILASMWMIHRATGEHLALPDFAGIAAGTAVAYLVRSQVHYLDSIDKGA